MWILSTVIKTFYLTDCLTDSSDSMWASCMWCNSLWAIFSVLNMHLKNILMRFPATATLSPSLLCLLCYIALIVHELCIYSHMHISSFI